MDYTSEDLVKIKKILFDLLCFFDSFCSQNGLKYYASNGTCLGAIRHHGFIPWDDDIDVLMPRKDYEKFLTLKPLLKTLGYEIYSVFDDGYYLPYAKICETKTTLVEFKNRPFLLGQFIDVFPMDEAENSEQCRKFFEEKRKSIQKYSRCLDRSLWREFLKESVFLKKAKKLGLLLFRKILKSFFLKKFLATEEKIKRQTGPFFMSYVSDYEFEKKLHNKEWFGDGVRVPFECGTIVVPSNYDAYLTKLFGNYMAPPPVEKRVSHHYHYFYDLNKRWKLEDVMKLDLEEQKIIDYKYE